MLLLHEKDVSVFSGVKKGCRAIGTNEGHNVVKKFWQDDHYLYINSLIGSSLDAVRRIRWLAELLFLSLNKWGLNFLQNECSQSSLIYLSPEKLKKNVYFSILKIFESWNWPKYQCYQSAKCQIVLFGIIVNLIIPKQLWKRRHS